MNKTIFIIILSFHFLLVFAGKYDVLPQVYKMEDYVTCMDKNDLYCKANIRLTSTNNGDNNLSKLINESISEKYTLDRNVIHRAMCIPRENNSSLQSLRNFIETRMNKELDGTGLLSYTEDVVCLNTNDQISSYDIYFMTFLVLYIFLILFASGYDIKKRNERRDSIYDKILTSLSVRKNWKQLCKVDGNEDYNKLKSAQGIRFITMVIIICVHSFLSYTIIYLKNPEEMEKFINNILIGYLTVMSYMLIQTFLLISSWIVTFQIYNIYRDHGEFTAKHAFVLFINRYFRFGVCSILLILFFQTSLLGIFNGPVIFDNIFLLQNACKHNWRQAAFFMHNDLYVKDMCNPIAWYLSVDFQLYAITIITNYLILKFNLNKWKIISFLFMASCILYGSLIYINEMDIFVRFVECMSMYNFRQAESIKIMYTSTYSNWTTSIIGMSFGIIYTKYRDQRITKNKIMVILWSLAFYGLPLLAIFIGNQEINGVSAAILGPLLKPLFSTGIGIGILGMSHNMGGIMKSIYENKYMVLVSNFSFSIYFFQFFVFCKEADSYTPLEFGVVKIVISYLFRDLPLCLIVGFITALLFEQPGINLQKIFLPQLPRKHKPKKKL